MTDPQALLAEQAAEVVGKLTDGQVRFALAASARPKNIWTIRRHAKLGRSKEPVLTHPLHRLVTRHGKGQVSLNEAGLAVKSILIERQGK